MERINDRKLFFFFPLLIALYETTAYLSNDMFLPALPEIKEDLNITTEEAQNALTIWFLGTALFQIIIGPLSDRYGRRPVLFTGAGIFTVGCIICAVTKNIDLFFLGRFLQGLMVPTCIITSYAILHEFFPTKKTIQILTLMGSIVIIGPAIGPLLGSMVLMQWDWPAIFWILLVLALIPIMGLYKIMPESENIGEQHHINLIHIIKRYLKLFSNRAFMGYSFIFSLNLFAPISWIVAGPFLAIEKHAIGETKFGLIQIQIFGAYAVSCLLVNRFLEKFEPVPLMRYGQIICVSSAIIGILLGSILPENLNVVVTALVLNSLGNGFVLAVSNRMAIETSTLPKGVVIAGFSMIISISTTLTSKFITMVYNFGVSEFCYFMAFASIMSMLIMVLLSKKTNTTAN